VERKNREIDKARQALEEKAAQLALTSKYKSEFMANMSHELRTPLNSLLILSDDLSRNSEGNLTPRQTEYAKTIHASGADLLTLINDILDLAKIESGTVAVELSEVRFGELSQFVERTFRHVADSKQLRFSLELSPDLPRSLQTDAKRLKQVIKNLLSNAFKFTERGDVTLEVAPVHAGWGMDCEALERAGTGIAFSVRDTGIGIPREKQQIIFEAFQQADGSTSRRYGGTGLGLNISREIAALLAGDIRVQSEPGVGSTFTLYLPLSHPGGKAARRSPDAPVSRVLLPAPGIVELPAEADETPALDRVPDDRARLGGEDERAVLIVENDDAFARLLLEAARGRGWRGIVASGGASAVALVRDLHPDAVTLDLRLPDVDGWRLLRLLKADLATRHMPVLVISTDDQAERALALGAVGVVPKPMQSRADLEGALETLAAYLDRTEHRVLLIGGEEDCDGLRTALGADPALHVACSSTLAEGVRMLDGGEVDCVVLAPSATPDPAAEAELEARAAAARPPVRVLRYQPGAEPAVAAGRFAQPEALVDAALTACHRAFAALPASLQALVRDVRRQSDVLAGRKVLVVDDDIRNIFALASVLEKRNVKVLSAESGPAAFELLEAHPDVDAVLMDIMMPGMDGFEAIREIRERRGLRSPPIIAVTARAMKGDREKTLLAGAWDYLAKPVDPDAMLSVLETWLQR
jgi:CheY-like chemotaxis protein